MPFTTIDLVQPRTKRQKEVLDFVTGFIDRNGHKPSYQQIARHLGVSSRAGIQRHIAALEDQGLISRRRDGGGFGIELQLQKIVTEKFCDVELIEIAGHGSEDEVPVRRALTIPRYLIGEIAPDEVLACRVPDDSMSGRQICEGDIVFLERRPYARRGQVVLARTPDERRVMGLYFNHGLETEIRPANDEFEPLIFPADEVLLEGAMLGLMRFPSIAAE